ncbi:hypothetical protein HYFRA_00009306 [Hymenoscyphus fraxineus]|uniref:Uncharacterized protein n=1 Tax=Hymenoscyphus fraxineus TaxID=746836 RepID=A0A9N9L3L4_9HELO|nr:hypothetical protein HYFRA_00009306 [Hymenoscyphus fraxineus]
MLFIVPASFSLSQDRNRERPKRFPLQPAEKRRVISHPVSTPSTKQHNQSPKSPSSQQHGQETSQPGTTNRQTINLKPVHSSSPKLRNPGPEPEERPRKNGSRTAHRLPILRPTGKLGDQLVGFLESNDGEEIVFWGRNVAVWDLDLEDWCWVGLLSKGLVMTRGFSGCGFASLRAYLRIHIILPPDLGRLGVLIITQQTADLLKPRVLAQEERPIRDQWSQQIMRSQDFKGRDPIRHEPPDEARGTILFTRVFHYDESKHSTYSFGSMP